MTIFSHEKRAKQAVRDSKSQTFLLGHISENYNIYPVEGTKAYRFLDDNSLIYLPTSDKISTCDELSRKLTVEDNLEILKNFPKATKRLIKDLGSKFV